MRPISKTTKTLPRPAAKPATAATKEAPAKETAAPAANTPATQAGGAVAKASDFDYETDSQRFQDNMGRQDLAVPFLAVLQANSPQCMRGHEEHVKDAEQGMFYNTVTKALYDGEAGITFVPVQYWRTYVEWKLREAGGGFVADHGLAKGEALLGTTTKDDKGRDILPNGNQLVNTAQYIALVADATEEGVTWSPTIISFTSTQLKKSRQMNTLIKGVVRKSSDGKREISVPMLAQVYQATTAAESNDKGSWYGWDIKSAGLLEDQPDGITVYNKAKALRTMFDQGAVVVDQSKAGDAGKGEDIPY